MTYQRQRQIRWVCGGGLVGIALILWTAPAPAQSTNTGTGSTSFGTPGGFSGNTGGNTGTNSSSNMNGSSGSTLNFTNTQFNTRFIPGISGTGNLPGLVTAGTNSSAAGRNNFGNNANAVTQYNPFVGYYANPFALGYPSTTSAGGYGATQMNFGQPIYTTTLGVGGALGTGQITISPAQPGFGTSSIGVRRTPTYITTIGFAHRPPATPQLVAEVQLAIGRSSRMTATRDIKVVFDGPAVVLQGWVADDHDRRLAEMLARLTPGVRDIRNELKVQELAPPPTPIR